MPDGSLWFQVEQEIANLLLDRLAHEQITPERAIQIARFVTQTVPHQLSDQQMKTVIPKLDNQFTELASVLYHHLQSEASQTKSVGLTQASETIKSYLHQKHGSANT